MDKSRRERLRAGYVTHEEWRADRDADLGIDVDDLQRRAVVRLPEPVERVEAALRSVGNGATLGYADNVSAFGDAVLGFGDGTSLPERYKSNLEQEYARDRYYQGQYPNTWKAAEIAGAIGGIAAASVGGFGPSAAARILPGAARATKAVQTTR